MKTVRNIVLLSLFAFSFYACGQADQKSNEVTNQKVEEFAKGVAKTDANILVLDVRTPDEFKSGHVAGAVNVNYYDDNFLSTALSTINKGEKTVVYVYCKAGSRSARAAKMIASKADKGTIEVINLLGGFDAWKRAGQAVKK